MNGGQPRNIKVKMGDVLEYEIKNLVDDEKNELSIKSYIEPTYAKISGLKYIFSPTQPT